MKRIISAAAALVLTLGLTSCARVDPDKAQESVQVIAMDTAMVISTYGRHSTRAAYASEDCIRALEALLSRTKEDSAVSCLNGAGTLELGEPGEELIPLLDAAERYRAETEGAFDITVAPVVSAWGFTAETFQVPGGAELEKLLDLVDGSAVRTEGRTVSLAPGQSIDLGGIAKGYAADKLTAVFRENEVPRALATLGGNVLAWGDRPDGTPWRVGVKDPARPDDQSAFVGVLELTNAFAVTSGGYQRCFEENGKLYHHIIDPATGYPADNGLTSVTVVAAANTGEVPGNGTMCDAYSTAIFVMGEAEALDFWRDRRADFDLVLVTADGRVVVTAGLAGAFAPDEESGYAFETVS